MDRRQQLVWAFVAVLALVGCGNRSASEVVAGEDPETVVQAAAAAQFPPASDAAVQFMSRVLRGQPVDELVVDVRGEFLGEGRGFSGPYVAAPDIAERIHETVRPLVGLNLSVSKAPILRLPMHDGTLETYPNWNEVAWGPGCGFPGDVHVVCSIVLHSSAGDGEVAVSMLSSGAFRDRETTRPGWLIDQVTIVVPLMPFTG